MTLINYPKQNIQWKGNTLFQIIASIQFNKKSQTTIPPYQLLKPLPLKIWRKEIVNINSLGKTATCSTRHSTSITEIDMPGSTIVTSINRQYSNGLVNTLDIAPTTITSENGTCKSSPNNCFSPEVNARRRVRSAGMVSRKFNENRNNDPYFTSTNEYLVSRNRTIKQNEYVYFKQSNMGVMPNIGNGKNNIYRPQGLSHCYRPAINTENGNNQFSYIWVDGNEYQITIPDGIYDIESLNSMFQNIMITNTHYFIKNNAKVFLLVFSYDTTNNSVVIICNPASKYSFVLGTAPLDATWSWDDLPDTDPYEENMLANPPYPLSPATPGATYIIMPDSHFADMMGFYQGSYSGGINEAFFQGSINSRYVTLYYKPNNQAFATQGAVDSSSFIQRAKYNAITNSAKTLKTAYGDAVANALAYGVSEKAYTEKDKIGFKRTAVPIVDKLGNICSNPNFIYRSR
jgi:hypothetical protein